MDSKLSQELMAALHESSTHNNQLHSPFLRLPAELRNQIYRLALSNTTIRVLSKVKESNKPSCSGCRFCKQLRQLRGVSLLLTCQQVYTEANDFLLPYTTFDVRQVGIDGFLEVYGKEKAAQVTSIVCRHGQIWSGPWPSKEELESLIALGHPIKKLVALRRLQSTSSVRYEPSGRQIIWLREILDYATGGRVQAGILEYSAALGQH